MVALDGERNVAGAPESGAPRPPRKRAEIHLLTADDLEAIRQHVLSLNERDRYMRFGFQATDEQINQYLNKINFKKDDIFGVFDSDHRIIGIAHLAYGDASSHMAEFGVSVSSSTRGHGLGGQLFSHSAQSAKQRGLNQMFIHTMTKNAPMVKIIKKSGAEIFRDGGDVDAYLNLLDNAQSHLWMDMRGMAPDNAAHADYGIKVGLKSLKDGPETGTEPAV